MEFIAALVVGTVITLFRRPDPPERGWVPASRGIVFQRRARDKRQRPGAGRKRIG